MNLKPSTLYPEPKYWPQNPKPSILNLYGHHDIKPPSAEILESQRVTKLTIHNDFAASFWEFCARRISKAIFLRGDKLSTIKIQLATKLTIQNDHTADFWELCTDASPKLNSSKGTNSHKSVRDKIKYTKWPYSWLLRIMYQMRLQS